MRLSRNSVKRPARTAPRSRPRVESLEQRSLLSGIVAGSGPGQVGQVSILNDSGAVVRTFQPFGGSYRGGVNVAQGDVNGDNVPDIIASMDRGRGTVRIFDGATFAQLHELQPYGVGYRGGSNVAFGQFTTGGGGDLVVSPAHGSAPVNIYDAATSKLLKSITPYGKGVRGIEVAAANLNSGFTSELITAPVGVRGGVVKAFDPTTGAQIATFQATNARYRGNVQVASGDFDHNGIADLVTMAGHGKNVLVTVWSSLPGNPVARQFVASAPGTGPTSLGINDVAGNQADQIALTRGGASPGGVRPIQLFDASGNAEGTTTVAAAGGGALNLASFAAPVHMASPLTTQRYAGANYSPTWPYWGPAVPEEVVGSATSNTITSSNPAENWYSNVYANQQVYVYPISNPGGGTIYPIASNTANTVTIQGSFANVPNNTYKFKILVGQLQDSDFFNSAFQGLWGGDPSNNTGRNDLGTIASTGFDLVRLYNWGPSRGNQNLNPPQPPQTDFQAHTAFLNAAYYGLHMQVMVPVSNFFLSNDPYAWVSGGSPVDPDSSLSFGSAPQQIQDDLNYFLKSITQLATDPNNTSGHDRINPAVQSIAVGNEIDLNLQFGQLPQPDATSKLLRTQWWIKNLHDQILAQFPNDTAHPLLTTVVSNADQGNTGGLTKDQQQSWFEVFVNGTDPNKKLPNGTVNGAAGVTPQQTFRTNVPGLASGDTASWYKDWFFNSLNIFQLPTGITQVLTQYDNGTPGTDWSTSWPGAKLDVPMMFTELGLDRLYADPPTEPAWSEGKIADTIASQVQAVETYISAHPDTESLGFSLFEFNDEPNKNGSKDPNVFHDAVYGMYKYYTSTNVNDFRDGTVQYTLNTGTTPSKYQEWPLENYVYPVYALNPVHTTDGSTLKDKIKGIIKPS